MNVEYRSFDSDIVEIRSADSGDGMTFSGYAAKYDSPSLPLPFTERIAPGAFTRSLKSRNEIKMFVNHSDLHVLASTRSKTLRIDDRPEGLFVEADLPDVSYANDLRVLIENGTVNSMSFGFSTVKDSWSDSNNRTLLEVRLHEVSVVTSTSAYAATTASVRNLTLIAKRTATDLDELTDAIAALEAGTELTDDQANVLLSVVDRSRPAVEAIVDATPDSTVTPISLLMKQLDLIAKNL